MDRGLLLFRLLMKDNTLSDLLKLADDSIITMLMRNNKSGIDKCMNIGEYDMESLVKGKFIPGCIYCFIYKAINPTTYIIDHLKFLYFDKLPIVYVTKVDTTKITGINLNFCSYDLRAAILNTIYNIDEPFFFDSNIESDISMGKICISNNVNILLNLSTGLLLLVHKLATTYNIPDNPNIFCRNYSIQLMRNVRMLEYWQWKYIPFLKYDNTVNKLNILDNIYKATHTDIKVL